MIPIDRKITYFPNTCFFAFLSDHHNYWCTPKHLFNQSSHYGKYRMPDCQTLAQLLISAYILVGICKITNFPYTCII